MRHSRRQQRTYQRVLVLTWKFLALKKLFKCGRHNIFKIFLNLFFTHENIKKRAEKVAHNQPKTFFSQYCLAAQTSPELIFHIKYI